MDGVPDHLDKREGGIIHTALAPVAKKHFDLLIKMDQVLNLTYASTSEGEFLENRTAELGVRREPALHAIREGLFDVVVPKGSRFFVDDLYYEVLEEGEEVPMRCETAGERGNLPIDGSDMMPVSNIPDLTQAKIGRIISAGEDEQTDEDLYRRYQNRVSRPPTSGNAYHYEDWALEVTGIGAVRVFPVWEGAGTVKVVVVSSNGRSPSPEKIEEVYNHIEDVRPIGVDVTVKPAIEKKVDVDAEVLLTGNVSLNDVVDGYIEDLTTIFRDTAFRTDTVRYSRLATLILEQDGVVDWQNLLINDGTQNVVLNDEEIAVLGSVTFSEF